MHLCLFKQYSVVAVGPLAAKPDASNNYQPATRGNARAMDKTSPKNIKCDQVQHINIYLSGNKKAMQYCLEYIDWKALNEIIAK